MSDNKEVSERVTIERSWELHAQVNRACKNCGAPGVFHAVDPNINPGCYDPYRAGQAVGEICPNCNAPRAKTEEHGKIWSKKWLFELIGITEERNGK